MTTLIADIEADGLLFDITMLHQISVIDVDAPGIIESYHGSDIQQGLDRLAAADWLVMHNGIGYDLPAIEIVTGIKLDWRKVFDTLVMSRLGNPQREGGHSLAAWAPRIGKDMEKVENEDWSVWTENMERRCGEDCRITLAIYDRLSPMWNLMPVALQIEHATAEEVRKTIARGFRLDIPHAHKLLDELLAEQEVQLAEFTALFPPVLVSTKPSAPSKALKGVSKRHPLYGQLEAGVEYSPLKVQEFNPGSGPQIASRLQTKYGWRPRVFTPSGQPQVTEEILRDLPYPEASEIANYLRTHKMVEQINAPKKSNGFGGGWLHHLRGDRVHPFLNPLKAVTGRLSCSAPNLQQVHKDPRMRAAWIPREGYVLLGDDAEGLELRCLGHYLAPHDDGAYIKMLMEGDKTKGTDVHSVVRDILGLHTRDGTKTAEYGWLYGAGDAKLGRIVANDASSVSGEINYDHILPNHKGRKPADSTVGKAIRDLMQEGITGLGVLVGDVKRRSKENGKLLGLDGRTLWSRSDHSALNLLLQSAGAILVKKAWTLVPEILSDEGLVEGDDYACVIQVHDEFQYEVRPHLTDVVGGAINTAIEEAGKQLNFRCPLAGAYASGATWAETH